MLFAPKGRAMTAQGGALGKRTADLSDSPEGARYESTTQ